MGHRAGPGIGTAKQYNRDVHALVVSGRLRTLHYGNWNQYTTDGTSLKKQYWLLNKDSPSAYGNGKQEAEARAAPMVYGSVVAKICLHEQYTMRKR
jgi:hypothetical protein